MSSKDMELHPFVRSSFIILPIKLGTDVIIIHHPQRIKSIPGMIMKRETRYFRIVFFIVNGLFFTYLPKERTAEFYKSVAY